LLTLVGCLRFIPLPLLRGLGTLLGSLLWLIASRRRHIVRTNLKLCFPGLDLGQRERLAKDNFVRVIQALLDRSWIWHAGEGKVRARLKLTGDPQALEMLKLHCFSFKSSASEQSHFPELGTNTDLENKSEGLVIFAPHFVGLDAGWTALALESPRRLTTIFTQQSSKDADDWVYAGRKRFGDVKLFRKVQGVSEIVRALSSGSVLYLLPDMDFGDKDTVFVPFYTQKAATVTSLSRFAKIGKAKVVTVTTQMCDMGYEIKVGGVWDNFPSHDLEADTARMNLELEKLIAQMPDQYYWVHRRFKTRPKGEASLY